MTGANRQAAYTSGTGTNTLTFSYTLVSGDTSSDLNYAATGSLALNGGTIVQSGLDGGTNTATLTLPATGNSKALAGNKALEVDCTVPTVDTGVGVTSTNADGKWGVGATITVTVRFTESVDVNT